MAAALAKAPPAPPPLPLSDQLCGPKVYDHAENREAVQLVDAAGAEISKNGAAALAQFRVKGSRWFSGDRYVFVLDPAGTSWSTRPIQPWKPRP
ncbi:MAG: hypothetical protein FJ060_09480 [Cyanobacteria bacterium K_Offshore_0m_m2_072]|nr:hypothetical protein [Cyanobacteria bacterium K_Offshore_0m_m2_072]